MSVRWFAIPAWLFSVPDGWKVVRVDGIPYLTPDRIRPLTEGEASDA